MRPFREIKLDKSKIMRRLEQDLTQQKYTLACTHYLLVRQNKRFQKPEPPSIVLHGALLLTKKPQDDVKRPQHSTKLREKKTVFSVSDPGGGEG